MTPYQHRMDTIRRQLGERLQTEITIRRMKRGPLPQTYGVFAAAYARPAYGTTPEAAVRVMLRDIENGYSPRTEGL